MTQDWTVTETKFDLSELHQKETLFTLSNGYLGTLGTFEEGYPDAYPITLINGVYDSVPDRDVEELVNCPDWLSLTIVLGNERFSLDRGQILSYQRQLDLHCGLLKRDIVWRSPEGYIFNLRFERMVSMAQQHVVALQCQIASVDFSGVIEVEASLNSYLDKQDIQHWECLNQDANTNAWLHLRCRHSGIELGMATHLRCSEDISITATLKQNYPALRTTLHVYPGHTLTVEKVVTIFTSREVEAPAKTAHEQLLNTPSYTILRRNHEAVWDELWHNCDVIIEGDSTAQLAVRYNLFQILAAAPRHDDLSIPAKTLSGLGYKGHIFWDTEIFLVPFFTFTQPLIARNLLSYRYHTLEGARRKARKAGYEGAMFAWEGASTGDEMAPRWMPGPDGEQVRIWSGDIELHINADIAYAVCHYWHNTGDDDWMQQQGAEIILDTAVFWGSRVEWNTSNNCYEICDVIGPDENHEHVNNNAFTNRMVQWHLDKALYVLEWLRDTYPKRAAELESKLNLTPQLQHWTDIARHMLILYDPQTNMIEQFEGFFDLEDVNLSDYSGRTESMQAILGVEATNQKQILKQPDVLMLLYLLRESALKPTLSSSNYQQILQTNWDYYTPRTDQTYGSSLASTVLAILACELEQSAEAYKYFMQAALVDLKDLRGNSSKGIHATSTGGVWQTVVFGFAGVCLTENEPIVKTPHLPPGWTRLKFKLNFRNHWYEFDLSKP